MGCKASTEKEEQWLLDGAKYRICPRFALHRRLGCCSGATTSGTPVVTWSSDDTPNQQWMAKHDEKTGRWSFHPVHAPKLALSRSACGKQLTISNPSASTAWFIIPETNEDGEIDDMEDDEAVLYLANEDPKAAKSLVVAEVKDMDPAKGTPVITNSDFHKNHNQQFFFQRVDRDPNAAITHVTQGRERLAYQLHTDGRTQYTISPKHTNGELVLGCASGHRANGTKIVGWKPDGSDNQKWVIRRHDGNLYSFSPVHAPHMVLDNPLVCQQCHLWPQEVGNKNQLFRLEDAGEGHFHILRHADTKLPLDVGGLAKDNGSIIWVWRELTEADNQKWKFRRVDGKDEEDEIDEDEEDEELRRIHPSAPPPELPVFHAEAHRVADEAAGERPPPVVDLEKKYHLVPKHAPHLVFGCASGNSSNGTGVVLWSRDGTPNQEWLITRHHNGLYSFHPTHAEDMSLDTTDYPGCDCHLWEFSASNRNQLFDLSGPDADGYFFIKKALADREHVMLDIRAYGNENGAKVQTRDVFTHTDNQLFKFDPVA